MNWNQSLCMGLNQSLCNGLESIIVQWAGTNQSIIVQWAGTNPQESIRLEPINWNQSLCNGLESIIVQWAGTNQLESIIATTTTKMDSNLNHYVRDWNKSLYNSQKHGT